MGLDKGSLILYDAQTRSRWSQLFGTAVSGPREGKRLAKLASIVTTWGRWKGLHPETTAYVKRSVPYPRPFTREVFARMARMEEGPVRWNDLIVGVEGHRQARAYLFRRLAKRPWVNDVLEATPILVTLSEDLSTARVFNRQLDGRTFTFRLTDRQEFRDGETGSIWDPLTGEALSGPLHGKKLKAMVATNSLWFAWKKYRPDTVLYDEGELFR